MESAELPERRRAAAEALVRSLRTGEAAAARGLETRLAAEVELQSNLGGASGRAAVLHRLSGQWAFTPVLARGLWTTPATDGDRGDGVVVEATFPGLGAAPARVRLRIGFGPDDLIARVEQEVDLSSMAAPAEPAATLPDHVVASINRALANNTPMVLSYIEPAGPDGPGAPKLSLRGSVQVSGPLELSIWARKASGGLVDAIATNPAVSLLYRDSPTRTTLTVVGRAAVTHDPQLRAAAYERSPEVEQNHDPDRTGAAVLVAVDRVTGTSPHGMVRVERPR